MTYITRAALTLSLLSAPAFFGCANHIGLDELDQDHATAFMAQDETLYRQLAEEDGWMLSPVLAADADWNRAGVRFDAYGPVEMQARVSTDGGDTFGPWQPVEITFAEGAAHNAHLDAEPGATHVQLRFMAPVEARVGFLAVELFEYVPPLEGDRGLGLEEAGEAEQGLAGDGVAVSRSEWGARASRCTSSHTPNRITVHHTVTPNDDSMSMPARMRQIQSYHMDTRGWCDVGYHFLVGQDGRVYQGRPERKVGAHAASANTNNAGVSYIGDYSSVAPSQAMLDAGARILRSLSQSYGITLNRTQVKGHRQVGTTSTSCPGNALYNRLQTLIDLANGLTSSAPPPASSGICGASRTGTWCDGEDVVDCRDGVEISRGRCQSGCQSMPQGTPDQCAAPAAPPPSSSGGSAGSYGDLPQDHYAFAAAEALRAAGALWGCAPGQFCPSQELSRAELAYALSVLDGVAFTTPNAATFADVASGHWAFAGVEESASRGILPGCTASEFCPEGPVSRAFGAVVLRRAKGLPALSPSSPRFSDVPLNHWASGAVERLAAAGIVNGCSATSYCPADALTRAQAAVLLARAYGL